MARTKVPAIDGWMSTPPLDQLPDDDGSGIPGVKLIGTRCVDSGTYFFPPERVMSRVPGHSGSELVEVELSTTGTLWSYTDAQYQPPTPFVAPSDPYEPCCLAAVELAEEVLGKPVRLGMPGGVRGLSDVISNPIHATGVGLLLHAREHMTPGRRGGGLAGARTTLERMRNWFQGNF